MPPPAGTVPRTALPADRRPCRERERARSTGTSSSARSTAARVPATFASDDDLGGRSSDVLVTRWRRDDAPFATGPAVSPAHAILTVTVAATDALLRVDGAVVHDGRLPAGMFQLLAPGQIARGIFRKPADLIRLHVPRATYADMTAGTPLEAGDLRRIACPSRDHVLEQLALSIACAGRIERPVDRRFLDGVGIALLARAAAVVADRRRDGGCEGLIPWRLKRVCDFVDAHLEAPLSLADMACAAGLSRMHFAAQFRRATGFSPRTYLTRRRIDRAQELLRHTTMPLVEIALSVGFQTQAHFTTIFHQLSGAPPGRWRDREVGLGDTSARDAIRLAAD